MISDSSSAPTNSRSSSKSSSVTSTSTKKVETSVLSEEDQLSLAIQNSLREISSDSSDSTENSTTKEANGDSNEVEDGGDGVIEIGFESDSDVVEVKENSSQSWTDYLGDEKG